MPQKSRGFYLFYLSLIWLCLLLYIFNRLVLKDHSDGLLWYFSVSHFSDLLAPVMTLSIANFALSFSGRSLKKLWQALVFSLACGLVWELGASLGIGRAVAQTAPTFDPADFLAYLAGGFIFWLITKIKTK